MSAAMAARIAPWESQADTPLGPGPIDLVLRCIRGHFVGRYIYVSRSDGEVFGSLENEPRVTVTIQHSDLSPMHCQVNFSSDRGEYQITDLKSQHGTWIAAGEEPCLLVPGCAVDFNGVIFEVEAFDIMANASEHMLVEIYFGSFGLRSIVPRLVSLMKMHDIPVGLSQLERHAAYLREALFFDSSVTAEEFLLFVAALSVVPDYRAAVSEHRTALRFTEQRSHDSNNKIGLPPPIEFIVDWQGAYLVPNTKDYETPLSVQPGPPPLDHLPVAVTTARQQTPSTEATTKAFANQVMQFVSPPIHASSGHRSSLPTLSNQRWPRQPSAPQLHCLSQQPSHHRILPKPTDLSNVDSQPVKTASHQVVNHQFSNKILNTIQQHTGASSSRQLVPSCTNFPYTHQVAKTSAASLATPLDVTIEKQPQPLQTVLQRQKPQIIQVQQVAEPRFDQRQLEQGVQPLLGEQKPLFPTRRPDQTLLQFDRLSDQIHLPSDQPMLGQVHTMRNLDKVRQVQQQGQEQGQRQEYQQLQQMRSTQQPPQGRQTDQVNQQLQEHVVQVQLQEQMELQVQQAPPKVQQAPPQIQQIQLQPTQVQKAQPSDEQVQPQVQEQHGTRLSKETKKQGSQMRQQQMVYASCDHEGEEMYLIGAGTFNIGHSILDEVPLVTKIHGSSGSSSPIVAEVDVSPLSGGARRSSSECSGKQDSCYPSQPQLFSGPSARHGAAMLLAQPLSTVARTETPPQGPSLQDITGPVPPATSDPLRSHWLQERVDPASRLAAAVDLWHSQTSNSADGGVLKVRCKEEVSVGNRLGTLFDGRLCPRPVCTDDFSSRLAPIGLRLNDTALPLPNLLQSGTGAKEFVGNLATTLLINESSASSARMVLRSLAFSVIREFFLNGLPTRLPNSPSPFGTILTEGPAAQLLRGAMAGSEAHKQMRVEDFAKQQLEMILRLRAWERGLRDASCFELLEAQEAALRVPSSASYQGQFCCLTLEKLRTLLSQAAGLSDVVTRPVANLPLCCGLGVAIISCRGGSFYISAPVVDGNSHLEELCSETESAPFVRLVPGRPWPLSPGNVVKLGTVHLQALRFNVGVAGQQGYRPKMEDEETVAFNLPTITQGLTLCHMYAVYDGHGGRQCARFLSARLHHSFAHQMFLQTPDIRLCNSQSRAVYDALFRAFVLSDRAFLRFYMGHGRTVSPGCATVLVVGIGDALWIANCGDARAVLSRNGRALDLSDDHKPSRPDEERRILASGGFVRAKRVLGRLAVSRAVGDLEYKTVGLNRPPVVLGEPEIRMVRQVPQDEFLLLACDGLFDVYSSQEAVDCTRTLLTSQPDPQLVVQSLVREAIEERKSRDNVTALLVLLQRR